MRLKAYVLFVGVGDREPGYVLIRLIREEILDEREKYRISKKPQGKSMTGYRVHINLGKN